MGLPYDPPSVAGTGNRSIAERSLQSFFQNLRKHVQSVSRLHLFGVFVGLVENDKDVPHPLILQVGWPPDIHSMRAPTPLLHGGVVR